MSKTEISKLCSDVTGALYLSGGSSSSEMSSTAISLTCVATTHGLGLHIYRVLIEDPRPPQHVISLFEVSLLRRIKEESGITFRAGSVPQRCPYWPVFPCYQSLTAVVLSPHFPCPSTMAINRLVDQCHIHRPLGCWLDTRLYFPVHTSSILLATPLYLIQDLAAITNTWRMQLRYSYASRLAFDLELDL